MKTENTEWKIWYIYTIKILFMAAYANLNFICTCVPVYKNNICMWVSSSYLYVLFVEKTTYKVMI